MNFLEQQNVSKFPLEISYEDRVFCFKDFLVNSNSIIANENFGNLWFTLIYLSLWSWMFSPRKKQYLLNFNMKYGYVSIAYPLRIHGHFNEICVFLKASSGFVCAADKNKWCLERSNIFWIFDDHRRHFHPMDIFNMKYGYVSIVYPLRIHWHFTKLSCFSEQSITTTTNITFNSSPCAKWKAIVNC